MTTSTATLVTPLRTRAEHLAWAKERALAELDADPTGRGPVNALLSMATDLDHHPDLRGHVGIQLGVTLAATGRLTQPDQVREHIGGYL